MATLFAETEKLDDLLMWLVAVNFADAAEHSETGSTLSTEASRMADMLMGALIVERVGQQQDRLSRKGDMD